MDKIETGIQGLCAIQPRVFEDERGHFFEAHNAEKFDAIGIESCVKQINQSFSRKGVLRGLHFQAPPHDQSKLVRCIRGRLFDVAVDIRRGSPTYGKWYGTELSVENRRMLYVPSGFAHGFYAITDCELVYLCGLSAYNKGSEGGLRYDDPDLGIRWPLDGEPVVNERDRNFPALSELESLFTFEEGRV